MKKRLFMLFCMILLCRTIFAENIKIFSDMENLSEKDFITEIETQNINKNLADENGNTLLMKALYFQKDEIVEYLIKKEVNLGLKNSEGKTALWYALNSRAENENKKIEIDKIADAPTKNAGEEIMKTAVVAALKKNEDSLNYLVQSETKNKRDKIIKLIASSITEKDDTLGEIIKEEAEKKDKQLLNLILSSVKGVGAEEAGKSLVAVEKIVGDSFIYALKHGNQELCEYIYKYKKIDLKASEYKDILLRVMEPKIQESDKKPDVIENGFLFLEMLAGPYSDIEVKNSLWLIEKGCSIEESDYKGWTPIFYAAAGNKKEIVEKLIEKNGDVNKKDSLGRTALMYAAINNSYDIFKLISEKSSKENIIDVNGNSVKDLYENNRIWFFYDRNLEKYINEKKYTEKAGIKVDFLIAAGIIAVIASIFAGVFTGIYTGKKLKSGGIGIIAGIMIVYFLISQTVKFVYEKKVERKIVATFYKKLFYNPESDIEKIVLKGEKIEIKSNCELYPRVLDNGKFMKRYKYGYYDDSCFNVEIAENRKNAVIEIEKAE